MAKKDDVVFRGTRSGVHVILNDKIEFETLKFRLKEKLDAAENFFQGAEVILDVGNRVLTTAELLELEGIITDQYGVRLLRVVHSEEEAEEISQPKQPPGGMNANPPARLPTLASSLEERIRTTLVVRRTLRSGQQLKYDGSVVILGDVNPGSQVTASGDIIVMGSLRGVAHAGARGDEGALVAALKLQPTQLRIGNHISRPPDGDTAVSGQPELAYVCDGMVVIAPLHSAAPI